MRTITTNHRWSADCSIVVAADQLIPYYNLSSAFIVVRITSVVYDELRNSETKKKPMNTDKYTKSKFGQTMERPNQIELCVFYWCH